MSTVEIGPTTTNLLHADGTITEVGARCVIDGMTTLSEAIYRNNVEKGWRKPDMPGRAIRPPAETLMLLVTEVAEAFEAVRDNLPTLAFEYSREQLCNAGDGIVKSQPYDWYENQCDIFSWSTTNDKFVAFGETMVDVRGNTILGKPVGLASELADIQIRLMDMADEIGIDLPGVTLMKHKYNQTRSFRHGGKAH